VLCVGASALALNFQHGKFCALGIVQVHSALQHFDQRIIPRKRNAKDEKHII
jgi:hypothetical protein